MQFVGAETFYADGVASSVFVYWMKPREEDAPWTRHQTLLGIPWGVQTRTSSSIEKELEMTKMMEVVVCLLEASMLLAQLKKKRKNMDRRLCFIHW